MLLYIYIISCRTDIITHLQKTLMIFDANSATTMYSRALSNQESEDTPYILFYKRMQKSSTCENFLQNEITSAGSTKDAQLKYLFL